jgi:hypothetical protein
MNLFAMKLLVSVAAIVLALAGAEPAFHSVPFSVTPKQKIVTVPCKIGNVFGNCILDSGANMSWVSTRKEFDEFPILYTSSSQSVNSSQKDVPVVQVDRFEVGDFILATKLSASKAQTFGGISFFGVIGADLIPGALVFDFAKAFNPKISSLIFADQEVAARFDRLPKSNRIELSRAAIAIEVFIGEKVYTALWDTGAEDTRFSTTFVASNPAFFHSIAIQSTRDGNGVAAGSNLYIYSGPTLKVAGQDLEPYIVADVDTFDSKVDIILGMDFIEKFTWYFSRDQKTYSVLKPN